MAEHMRRFIHLFAFHFGCIRRSHFWYAQPKIEGNPFNVRINNMM